MSNETPVLTRARAFLQNHARKLEWALFRHHVEGAGPEDALNALAEYRNPDGGFGRALEPDVRCPDSSVLATTTGLQTLRSLQTPANHPLVSGAVRYLLQTLNRNAFLWPMLPVGFDKHPHAPWWTEAATESTNAQTWGLNPRAEVLAHLVHWPNDVPRDLLDRLGAATLDLLDQRPAKMEMHDLLCCLRLLESHHLPESWRPRLLARLLPAAEATVERDPAKWETTYCLTPLDTLDHPSSPLAPRFTEPLRQHLRWLFQKQLPDGSWPVTFSWGPTDEAKAVTREWQGIRTLRIILALSRFGLP